ncbi:polyhydroxyalkanoate synthesis repressor PhaR [Oceanibaculum pacificum]|uniref:Polyhydroxyalkanoate synthesis repressor n=1 Tax=Oceanibaculum pacificum TaxID=580166 RepID=A0A154W4F1_9PROT|nr:polyhydroxyalkanoate synthesis repressor PhaR [Oceanibaculum pacificum]KZD08343.1 polyhydroxyalkanoate synthesis repressor [Oceanibaculum pacificum]
MAEKNKPGDDAPITIKKYANRRLYNTATSSYVTLDHLCQMVKDGVDFQVFDAKTGEDITHSVLTQIIFEEEGKGQSLLPISFLRMLISFYGDSLQWVLPKYLEHTMSSFARNQDRMRSYVDNAFGGLFPFGTNLEEMGKQNMAMLEGAMRMFNPFGMEGGLSNGVGKPPQAPHPAAHPAAEATQSAAQASVVALKDQIDNLQKQIDAMAKLQIEVAKAGQAAMNQAMDKDGQKKKG